jgi:hypothetical protein
LNQSIEERNINLVFSNIKIILLISGQMSLIFHPMNKDLSYRGEILAKAFNLPNDIAFLGDRKMRNHIAHMDERLQNWHDHSPNRNIVRLNFGPRNAIGGDAISSGDIFEQYIPDERTIIFRGDEYNLQALLETATRLLEKAKEISSHVWWTHDFRSYFPNIEGA